MKHTRRTAWLTAVAAVVVCSVLIGAMAYEAYWAPRLCQVAEPERAPALQRIEKIGSVTLAEPHTHAENISLPAQKADDE